MSADNWTKCPQCEVRNGAILSKVTTTYGKVPVEDFVKQLEDVSEFKITSDSLREDYQIGIWNGKFNINYTASCESCNFQFRHKTEIIPVVKR